MQSSKLLTILFSFISFHCTAKILQLRDTYILCTFYLTLLIAGNAEEEENTTKADPSRICRDIHTEKGAA